MPKKKRTLSPEHLAKLQAGRAKAQAAKLPLTQPSVEQVSTTQSMEAMQRQIDEIMGTNALLKAALLNKQPDQSVEVGRQGTLIGEVEKYLMDPDNYPDPTARLAAEPKLVSSLNFPFNYELQYKYGTSPYTTQAGVHMIEPKFMVQLNKIVINDQGEQTDKRYVVKRLIFHEDPQAALVIARDNSISVDKSDEKTFLDEMRYLRVRDWLFDIFWPKPANPEEQITEEVIGGSIVQVFTKSSVEPSEVPFDKLNTKVQA